VDEGGVGQSRTAEPGPQLEPLLKRLLIFLVRRVLDDDGVITFADFAALFEDHEWFEDRWMVASLCDE
jgi:hypothetical protein